MSSPEAQEKKQRSMEKLWDDWRTGERDHPMLGKKHTNESKQKISDHHIETGCALGERNGMWGRKHTAESREKMSIGQARSYVNETRKPYGRNGHRTGKYTSAKMNVNMHYRSSWERAFMIWCDFSDEVLEFQYEPFSIVYWDSLKHKRRYIPDFLVNYSDCRQVLYELKPKAFVNSKAALLKAAAAREHCVQNGIDCYQILTREQLEEMDVL